MELQTVLTLGLPTGWWQDESAWVTAHQGGEAAVVRAVRDSSAPHPSRLADTGADVVELLALGFLFLVLGMALVRRRSLS